MSTTKTREKLVDVARQLFAKHGLENTTMNDIAVTSGKGRRTRKYDYVMIKAGENLLIANPKFDITKDVVKGLNKRYKISPQVAEQIKKVDVSGESSAK